jgi:hypothetical protein
MIVNFTHLCFSAQMFGSHAGASGDKDHEAVVGMINQNMQENWVSTVVQRRKFQRGLCQRVADDELLDGALERIGYVDAQEPIATCDEEVLEYPTIGSREARESWELGPFLELEMIARPFPYPKGVYKENDGTEGAFVDMRWSCRRR